MKKDYEEFSRQEKIEWLVADMDTWSRIDLLEWAQNRFEEDLGESSNYSLHHEFEAARKTRKER